MKATLRNYRHSPRKVRVVANLVRGKNIADAMAELSYLPKKAALPLEKLLKSAVASAKENFKENTDTLIIKEIRVDKALTLKRFQPAARGSAHPIRKRGSHISVTLGKPVSKEDKKVTSAQENVSDKEVEIKAVAKKRKPKTPKK